MKLQKILLILKYLIFNFALTPIIKGVLDTMKLSQLRDPHLLKGLEAQEDYPRMLSWRGVGKTHLLQGSAFSFQSQRAELTFHVAKV